MVKEAVDDMFDGCVDEMEKKIESYFEKEIKDKTFKITWSSAATCANRSIDEDQEDKDLTNNHRRAICAYTSYFSKIINPAVRQGKNVYGSTFKYHAFYYWLTRAIQILKEKQTTCHTVYRRTNDQYDGDVNQIMRFGYFASSSFRTNKTSFGSRTCFKITTCLGAYLKSYPTFKDREQEVLIPPYETFKITEIKRGFGKLKEMEDCQVTFILEHEAHKSNVNCRLAHNR